MRKLPEEEGGNEEAGKAVVMMNDEGAQRNFWREWGLGVQRQGMGSRAMEGGDRKLSQALFRGGVAPFLQLEKDGKDEDKGRVWEGSKERWLGEV